MCVFNFFFWKSWLAGEELYLLQKENKRWSSAAVLIPDVRFPVPASQNVRTISRRFAADGLRCRCAQVAPPRGAALAAARRRAAEPLPGSAVSLGLKRHVGGQALRQKKRDLLQKARDSVCWQSNAARFVRVRGPSAVPREVRGPNALEFVKQTGLVRPEIALDRAARG